MTREITLEEALETLAMFYNITPGQLRFICEEFHAGRGGVVINEIIDHRYRLDKANNQV